jgi:hypothetical protein
MKHSSILLKRGYGMQRLVSASEFPIEAQFILVKNIPLNKEGQGAPWENPRHDSRFNSDRYLIIAVSGMKMRRGMIVIEKIYDDSQKPR